MHDPGAWAIPLSDTICTDAAVTGGKAAMLARLAQDGFPVPDAYVLPQAVFARHCPDATQDRPPPRPQIATALKTTLARVCDELAPAPGDRLVVRSSAMGEDGEAASFAGQHATYYYVDAASIEKAVVDCWLSLWSDPALAYRRSQGSAGTFGMAVIVQRMIQSERSGVCFTIDPTGARADQALLEASWGLGAALMDGRVSPDRFWLDERGTITERKIARKRLKVAENLPDPRSARLEPVPLKLQTRPSVSDVEAGQIAAMAREISERTGTPQDVEWAIDGDELFLLQSRPLTTLPTPARPVVMGRWVLFKPTAENFSEPLTPMTVDLLRRVLPPFGRFIDGRYYLNADLMAKLLPWSLDDEALTDLLLMRGTPEVRLDWRSVLSMSALLGLGYLAGGALWHRSARLAPETLAAFEDRCRRAVEDSTLDPLTTLTRLVLNDHALRPMGENAILVNLLSVRYFLLIELLRRVLERIAPSFDQTKISLLVTGGDAMLSQQMVESIRALADTARGDTELSAAMRREHADLQGLVLRLGEYHPFTVALEQFMQRFGHRGIGELDLMAPRWREDNTTVLYMVRNYLAAPDNQRTDGHGLRLAAVDELHQAIRHRWQQRLVDRLVGRIRHYVTLRENSRHYHTMGLAAVRLKLKQLEQALIQSGRLHCEDDVFFLEYPEAVALKVGQLDWLDVEPLIRARRRDYQRHCLERPPDSFNIASRIPVLASQKNILVGDCACPGVASGTARVICDPTIGAELAPGEILVAPYTDPAWTPLFPGAGAIIVEVGSYLSHAGTVAREYQVPCLVDVHDCTRRIRSGQQVRVNATEGWVEVVE
ncbi:MAG: PEP/pyruvate-binding domain-containing protein [Pseudomonadales bacterium]|jgi:pyruvate,water dikinase